MEGIEKGPTQAKVFALRQARDEDVDFLFTVSTEAMRPVSEQSTGTAERSDEERRAQYQDKFVPSAIQIIQYQGEDVGRLRVVRSSESIYVGGIQILPEFQGKGIGTALFTDLISESKQTGTPIVLEVHDVNTSAIAFYTGLGFIPGEQVGDQTVMRYIPSER